MGSTYSVINDTGKPIWVSDGVCHAALWGTIGGVVGGFAFGGAIAGITAAAQGATPVFARLFPECRAPVKSVSNLLSYTPGTLKGLSAADEEKILQAKQELKTMLEGFKRIDPGSKYTVSGTLSLVWTAYVIYDDGREAQRDCWTGATANSENEYPVSEYF